MESSLNSIITKLKRKYQSLINSTDFTKWEWDDGFLINKYKSRIPRGWYGFSGIHKSWSPIIQEFLDYVEAHCPDYEIHQIKSKFGGLRFYVNLGTKADEQTQKYVEKQIAKLEDWLRHEDLCY
jgi:hypothetical protein